MFTRSSLAIAASAIALIAAQAAGAQTAPTAGQATPPAPGDEAPPAEAVGEEVVVTGIRRSLEQAADIKQNAIQVVDSIVAQDIGKLPDPTTAAALQRVPGIQVSTTRNNELGDVRVRGLPDILTTVNGRETFTATGRRLDLQDLPAEALSRVDVYKSQTPDLIEGGLAGVIDLKLNKPFNFSKPTVVVSARGNYGKRIDKFDPQLGVLFSSRADTGIGEVGALLNATYSEGNYYRNITNLFGLRSAAATPLNTPGVLIPNILQSFPEEGKLKRFQMNAALQWRPTDTLEVYADAFYTQFDDRGARYGANTQAFTTNVTLSNLSLSSDCYQARVTAAGQNPTIQTTAAGVRSLQAFTVQNLCYLESGRLNNPVVNLTTQARDIVQKNKSIAGGLKWASNGTKVNFDVSYQASNNDRKNIIVDIGRRVPTFDFVTDDNHIARYTVNEALLLDPAAMFIRNSVQQTYSYTVGDLFAAQLDAEHEFDGILKRLKGGVRYARRQADNFAVVLNTAVPGGNIGTATESTARLVSSTGLPSSFLSIGAPSPSFVGGGRFLVPNPDYILSESGLDSLRTYVGLRTGRPAFQPDRQFNADETTWGGYGQLEYDIPVGDTASLDGVVGGRYVTTKRTIQTFSAATAGGVTTYTPVRATANDKDFLPTVTARFKMDNGFQSRLGYTRSIRRPEFGDLNPSIILSLSNNPFVQSTGSAGNPNLREQKSSSYDGTLEYYFKGGYVALAGYYRKIKDRVISGPAVETISGVDYNVTRPRNIGAATLKGLELSGQYFFDFLPGALSGVGVQGSFTLSDSKIGGTDPLAGNPLQGVSKSNYTAGLLYEKYGLSGRLVYTYRSKYFDSDQTGSISVRPIDPARVTEVYVPTLLSYVRPAGRLDFNIGYDINKAIRIDVGGTNILRQKTVTYLGLPFQSMEGFYDETTYSVGVRVRL